MRKIFRKIDKSELIENEIYLANEYSENDNTYTIYYHKKKKTFYAVEEDGGNSILVFKLTKPMAEIKKEHIDSVMYYSFCDNWRKDKLKMTPKDVFMHGGFILLFRIEYKHQTIG